jgi:hypothetical protein
MAGGAGTPGPHRRSAASAAGVWSAAIGFAILFIALLNAAYFVQSSATIKQAVDHLGANTHPAAAAGALSRAGRAGGARGGGLARAAADGPGRNRTAEAATLEHLQRYVLKLPNLERPPEPHFWLETPTASDKNLTLYRTKVREFVAGEKFKERVESLRQNGRGRGIVIATGGPYYLPQVRRARRPRAAPHCSAAGAASGLAQPRATAIPSLPNLPPPTTTTMKHTTTTPHPPPPKRPSSCCACCARTSAPRSPWSSSGTAQRRWTPPAWRR